MSVALEQLGELLCTRGGLLASLLAGNGQPSVRAGEGGARPQTGSVQPLARESGCVAMGAQQPVQAGPAQLAAAGPRAAPRAPEYELLVEAIYEGYLLHYGVPRLLRPADADLGLLAGDQLYALGLDRLVALGDLQAVAELADVITLTALAHGDGREALAGAIWAAGARAVGWGPSEHHRRAKALACAGDPDALAAMRLAGQRDDI